MADPKTSGIDPVGWLRQRGWNPDGGRWKRYHGEPAREMEEAVAIQLDDETRRLLGNMGLPRTLLGSLYQR